jgi:hypothetical protein
LLCATERGCDAGQFGLVQRDLEGKCRIVDEAVSGQPFDQDVAPSVACELQFQVWLQWGQVSFALLRLIEPVEGVGELTLPRQGPAEISAVPLVQSSQDGWTLMKTWLSLWLPMMIEAGSGTCPILSPTLTHGAELR